MRSFAEGAWLAEYRIFETSGFVDDLGGLDPSERARLQFKLGSDVYPRLQAEPHYGPQIRKLRDWRPPTWRFRVGHYRAFYEIDEDEHLVLLTALHRRDKAYRR